MRQMSNQLSSFNWKKINSIIFSSLLLITTAAKTDSISVPQGSFYIYEIDIDKGITFKGTIILSDKAKPITIEIYDPSGEIIEKTTVLDTIEITFITVEAGRYVFKFYNFESEVSVELTFSYDVKRELPVIPGFPFWALIIGTAISIIYARTSTRSGYDPIKSNKLGEFSF